METQHDFAAWRFFDSEALRADEHASITADFDDGADTPHIIPPRATRWGTQGGALFFAGLFPGALRGLAQFAMDFLGVALRPQGVDLGIGGGDFGDLFTGEVGGQPALPVLVGAFDFAFGLGRGGHSGN